MGWSRRARDTLLGSLPGQLATVELTAQRPHLHLPTWEPSLATVLGAMFAYKARTILVVNPGFPPVQPHYAKPEARCDTLNNFGSVPPESSVSAENDLVLKITPVHLDLRNVVVEHEARSVDRASSRNLPGVPFTFKVSIPLRRTWSRCIDEPTWVPSFVVVAMFPKR